VGPGFDHLAESELPRLRVRLAEALRRIEKAVPNSRLQLTVARPRVAAQYWLSNRTNGFLSSSVGII